MDVQCRLPFSCVNYTDTFGALTEALGRFGPGMKPHVSHEVRGPYLTKEVEETKKIYCGEASCRMEKIWIVYYDV